MIVFDLECVNGHTFEGWFEDGATFETQQEQGLISCPVCETSSVAQKLSAVAVKTSSPSTSAVRAKQDALAELGARLTEYVDKNFENVGSDFATEALKMHYGGGDQRNIRGTTTKEEDKTLNKEGIPVFKLPLPAKPEEELN